MVNVKELPSYKNFGKCLEISNERLVIYVTIDVGPRIIYCSIDNCPNLMHEDIERKTSQDVLGLLKTTGQKFNQTIVMITHNDEIAQMADRTIRIEDGHIV